MKKNHSQRKGNSFKSYANWFLRQKYKFNFPPKINSLLTLKHTALSAGRLHVRMEREMAQYCSMFEPWKLFKRKNILRPPGTWERGYKSPASKKPRFHRTVTQYGLGMNEFARRVLDSLHDDRKPAA